MDIPAKTSQEVEDLVGTINDLAHDRQELRSRGAGFALLERNRLQIVHRQWELSQALISRHLHPQASSRAVYGL
jgi:hypothetical protein